MVCAASKLYLKGLFLADGDGANGVPLLALGAVPEYALAVVAALAALVGHKLAGAQVKAGIKNFEGFIIFTHLAQVCGQRMGDFNNVGVVFKGRLQHNQRFFVMPLVVQPLGVAGGGAPVALRVGGSFIPKLVQAVFFFGLSKGFHHFGFNQVEQFGACFQDLFNLVAGVGKGMGANIKAQQVLPSGQAASMAFYGFMKKFACQRFIAFFQFFVSNAHQQVGVGGAIIIANFFKL